MLIHVFLSYIFLKKCSMYKHETFIAVVNTDLSEETGLKVELLVLHFSISIAKQVLQF